MTVQPMRFGDLHGDGADAGAARVHQDRFARLQSGVIEQHVLDGRIGDAHAGGVFHFDAVGDFHHQPRRMVGDVLSPAVDVETADAEDVFAEIVAAAQALAAGAAGIGGERDDAVAGRDVGDAVADRDHLAGRLGADRQRIEAFGERHAAQAEHVDVVDADEAHPQLHFARTGRRRRVDHGAARVPYRTASARREFGSCVGHARFDGADAGELAADRIAGSDRELPGERSAHDDLARFQRCARIRPVSPPARPANSADCRAPRRRCRSPTVSPLMMTRASTVSGLRRQRHRRRPE